jgi:site-specific recombinase XerD
LLIYSTKFRKFIVHSVYNIFNVRNMKNTSNILFYIRRFRENSDGKAPIYLRITIKGKRAELTTNRFVIPDKWSVEAQAMKGSSEEARILNIYLTTLRNKVLQHINSLELQSLQVTADSLRQAVLGIDQEQHTLISLFNYHNDRMKSLVGRDYAKGTYKRYVVTIGKVKAFLLHQYKKEDIDISELNHAFITNFEFYLKTKDEIQNNTAMKYIKNLKKVVRIAIENEWLDRDPFIRFKCTYKDPNRKYLTESELKTLESKSFEIQRLDQVRDMFVFSCYTGLAYADMDALTPADVKFGIDGERWITTYRQKTDSRSSIPLLPQAVELINKYKDHPESNNSGKLLPVLSNQKLNAYLKEIATLCGISKLLTFHTARHTFATTVTLTNGVPIETVSRMLGHTSIKTTQIYSKVVDSKVSSDMQNLKGILNLQQTKQTESKVAKQIGQAV